MTSVENEPTSSIAKTQQKLPYKRIKRAVDQLVTIALPLHLQLLKAKSEEIEVLKSNNSPSGLWGEQIDAVKYLKLLKSDLYELEQLYSQVEEKDQDIFYNTIKDPIKEAVEAVAAFTELHPDADEPLPEFSLGNQPSIPEIICHLDQECESPLEENQPLPVVYVEAFHTSKSAFPDWTFLRRELLEVHSLISNFASLVFSQKEKVDTIQGNVQDAQENVQEGVHHLKKASVLKAATFPLAGAIVGGILLGPVGALAGFKILGTAACMAGGGALGYKAGVTLKKKQQMASDFEMQALTFPSKEKSSSNPELSTLN